MCWSDAYVQSHPELDALTPRHTLIKAAVGVQLLFQIDFQLSVADGALGRYQLFLVVGSFKIKCRPVPAVATVLPQLEMEKAFVR